MLSRVENMFTDIGVSSFRVCCQAENWCLHVHLSAPICCLYNLVMRTLLCDDLPLIFCPFLLFALKPNFAGGNYDSRFDVGKASGTLIVARPLDAEQKSNYNLTVEATDGTRTVSTQVIETLMKRSEADEPLVVVLFFPCEDNRS